MLLCLLGIVCHIQRRSPVCLLISYFFNLNFYIHKIQIDIAKDNICEISVDDLPDCKYKHPFSPLHRTLLSYFYKFLFHQDFSKQTVNTWQNTYHQEKVGNF